jgi:hypothetical protein
LPLFSQSKDRKKEVIFIKNFVRKEGSKVDQKLIDTISQQFYLSAQTKYGDQYDVNDESVIKVLNAKAEELLRKNCDADKCMEAISEKIKARFSVYGEIEDLKGSEGSYILRMTNLVRDPSGDVETKSIPITFQEFQKDYYIGELVKAIENPKYKPDSSKAPKVPTLDLKMGELSFKPIETGKLPDINTIKIDGSQADLERYKTALNKANKLREEKKWKESSEIYLSVYDLIQKKDPEDQKKLKSISELAETYFSNSIGEYHKAKIEEVTENLKGDESNISSLNKAIQSLADNAKEYEGLKDSRFPQKAYNQTLANSYQERVETLIVRKFRLLEAKADKAYYSQDFAQAIGEYSNLLKDIRSFNGITPAWKQLDKDLSQKKDTTYKNGQAMVASLIDQLVLAGEENYEEWVLDKSGKSDEPSKCKDNFDKALDILQKDAKYKPFISQDLIDRYNRKVTVIRKDTTYPSKYYPKTYDERVNEEAQRQALEAKSNQEKQAKKARDSYEYQRAEDKFRQNRGDYIWASMIWPGWGQAKESDHWKGYVMPWVTAYFALDVLKEYSEYNSAQKKYSEWSTSDTALALPVTTSLAYGTYLGNQMDSAAGELASSGKIFTNWWAFSMIDLLFFRPTSGFVHNSPGSGTMISQMDLGGLFFQVMPRKTQAAGGFNPVIETEARLQWSYSF